MSAKSITKNYEQLSQELEAIMLQLQSDELNIDAALKHYERGLQLVKELKAYLQTAENKITELRVNFDDGQ